MKQRYQKITVIAIIAIVSISLIGTSFVAIFLPDDTLTQESQDAIILQKEYDSRKEIVLQLDKKLAENPDDTEAQLALADALLDKSRVSSRVNAEEFAEDLRQAIDLYRAALEKNEDTGVMHKLAIAAFWFGDNDLSESTYKQLLALEPQNADALFGYGMLLFYNVKDYKQAEEKWQQGLSLVTDEQQKKEFEDMLSLVKVINANANEPKSK